MSLAVVAAVDPSLVFASVPTIHGDGIHDDATGLQALMDGKPFRVEGNVVHASGGEIKGGKFAISRTLRLTKDNFEISNSHFVAMPDFEGPALLRFDGCSYTRIKSCYFDAKTLAPSSGAAILGQG